MTSPCETKLEMLADPEALSRRVADWMLEMAATRDGVLSVSLSGGSTPRRLYQLLAGSPYRDKFPRSRTHWSWGDERFVSHDDTLSNYRIVREALLSRAPIPDINIHPIPTEGITPEEAASAYEHQLKSFYGAERLDSARGFAVENVGKRTHSPMGLAAAAADLSADPGNPPLLPIL
jgi:6-phosphogluconolactonase